MTLTVAATGLAITALPGTGDSPWVLVGVGVAAWVLSALGLVILVSVRRFGRALAFYEGAFGRIHQKLFDEFGLESEVAWPGRKPRSHDSTIGWIQNAQHASELAVGLLGLIFALGCGITAGMALLTDGYDLGQKLVLASLCVVVVPIAAGIGWVLGSKQPLVG